MVTNIIIGYACLAIGTAIGIAIMALVYVNKDKENSNK